MDDFDGAMSALGIAAPAPVPSRNLAVDARPAPGATTYAPPSNNPGNIRPQGSNTGFQSYSTPEAGLAAMDDNLKAYGAKHGINTISGVVGRWAPPSENNTPAYVADVSKRLGIAPDAQIDLSNPIVRHALTTAITLHENGPKILTTRGAPSTAANAAPPAAVAPDTSDFDGAMALLQGAPASAPSAAQPTPSQIERQAASQPRLIRKGDPIDPHAPITSPEADLTFNQVSGMGSTIAGGIGGIGTGLYKLAQTGSVDQAIDAASNTIRNVQQAGTYQPRTEEGAKMVEQFGSNYNPLNWIPKALQYAGDTSGEAVADAGYPAAGALLKGAGDAAPLALGLGIKGMMKGAPEAVPPRIEPSMAPLSSLADKPRYKLVDGKPVLIEQGAEPQMVAPTITPAGQGPASVPLSQVGKTAPVNSVSAAVPATADAVQTMAQTAPAKLFPETPTLAPGNAGSKFTPTEQANRGKILQSVGIDPNSIRRSAIEGDAISGSTDFQTAKVDSAAGRLMKTQLDNEKAALNDHASTLIKDTGGSTGIDQSTLYSRGNTILSPLDSMREWFDTKTSALYKAADERAQGVPVQLDQFRNVLGDASELTNSDRTFLPDAVTAYAKKHGMVGEDGSISGTAMQAETLRKYLNEKWSPDNSGFVGKLKDALDEEVMVHAGQDLYGQSRALRTLRAETLDNPKGIAQITEADPRTGINRKVEIEKIPDKVTGLSVDQFGHVVRTLKNAPPELQAQSGAALAEIKAQFANKIQSIGSSQQGQWNAKGVTNYLQNNAARMSQVFTPEEIGKFRNLNDAGHILAKDQSYPGAAVQAHNLVTRGTMAALPAAGASMGGYVGGPFGAAAGAMAGRAAANSIGDAAAVRNVKKRMVRLSDIGK